MQMPARSLTLTSVVIPGQGILRNAALVFGASMFIALSAYVAIPVPWSTVPITGQTLAVLLTGAALGSRLGFLAMVAYLAEGMVGWPVFANGSNAWTISRTLGTPAIIGSSAGYLYSYPFAAFAVGYLAERGWDKTFFRSAAAMLIGSVVIYAFGLAWFAVSLNWHPILWARVPGVGLFDKTLIGGLLPFIPGDLTKIALAAGTLPGAWSIVDKIRGKQSPDRQ